MFHIGHLNILKNAKANCDYLIVGVSTDALVKSYKYQTPEYTQNERISIVQAIKFVDKVVLQTTLDKNDAWKKYHFNMMFHGSDWKGTTLYDKIKENLLSVGVKTIFLPHTDGISTSLIKSKKCCKKIIIRLRFVCDGKREN